MLEQSSGTSYIGRINDYTAPVYSAVGVVMPEYQTAYQPVTNQRSNSLSMFTDLWGEIGSTINDEFSSIVRRDTGEYLVDVNDFESVLECIGLCIHHKNYIQARDEFVKIAEEPYSEIPWSLSTTDEYKNQYIESINMEFQTFENKKRPDGTLCSRCGHDEIISLVGQVTRALDEGTTDKQNCAKCKLPYEPDFQVYSGNDQMTQS